MFRFVEELQTVFGVKIQLAPFPLV